LTRYEAWPVTGALVAITGLVSLIPGTPVVMTVRRVALLAVYPAVAIGAFFLLSRVTVGEWFVTGGFFVPDNRAHGKPLVAAASVWWGLRHLAGTVTTAAAAAAALAVLIAVLRDRRRVASLVSFALAATAALPWYAFFSGHPFRIRYMTVLVAAVATFVGLAVGLLPRRLRAAAGVVAIAVALLETPPFSATAAMVQEAQWDRPQSIGRRAVTRCLEAEFVRPRDKVLASMGSLAHYMQELSHGGFALDDFVHEGIGELWPEALQSPRRHVRWILFEERAEGGDMLTALRREHPEFVDGFERVCEGGGVALYRRSAGTGGPPARF
jgi:hypothetical protein